MQNMTGRELNKLWKDYFVVSFVRNPFQRAVSMYRMFMREVELGGTEDRTYTWNQFCADPAGFGAKCEADEKCKTRGGQSYTFTHMQPQMDCMVTEGGGWAVDFIGRVEHMDEDLQAVLDELERRREADVPPVRPLENGLRHYNERGCNHSKEELERLAALGKPMAKEQYCEPEQYYEGQHAACLRAIPHHYASDVHMLGFD
ncbi:hypothetical protein CHLNCDRAFT_139143 [Chlorella variabilis]|uniref:Sulfotransferase n=1 Tax=Chlorella variabilis TaxID=554065 RepID=E1ZPJ2_CHLVA|nr:hypothetical protein CHLNCDRAFT_139143 [Chlorella variabilis]EFN52333.1 hypothetical protein CHLNCDRAFT_139143 [Chlorella variabilis]|eukprot:XP_005844435.1 hypothetical protein CHLNCDRAFT_139143 [Chlorella variabilis]